MSVTIEIPVPAVVKKYYEHPANFGLNMVADQRSAVGIIITTVLSFYPLESYNLPIKWRDKKENLALIKVQVCMPLKEELVSPHHLRTLGETLTMMYEREFFSYCVGRFMIKTNYESAIAAWMHKFNLEEDDANWDTFRRNIQRKYGDRIMELLRMEEEKRREALKEGIYY